MRACRARGGPRQTGDGLAPWSFRSMSFWRASRRLLISWLVLSDRIPFCVHNFIAPGASALPWWWSVVRV